MRIVYLIMVVFVFLFAGAAFSQESLPLPSTTPQEQSPAPSTPPQAQSPLPPAPAPEWVRMITPLDNADVIGKKPEIKVEFIGPSVRNNLLVTLDGTDITQILILSDKGFEYRPVMPVPVGSHTLVLTAVDGSGAPMQKTVTFKSRHLETFEEASSNNDASIIYTQAVVKPKSTPPAAVTPPQNQSAQPTTTVADFNSKVEGNLKSDNKIKNGNWEVTLNGNIRYFDQDAPAPSPLTKGIDVANWLMTGTYQKDSLKLQASVGDVQVTETSNTINLNRRGGLLQFDYDIFQFRIFNVKGRQTYGMEGGLGIGTGDNILGASTGVKLFERKVEFKTIYLTGESSDSNVFFAPVPPGGTPLNPFGTSNQPGNKKGEVVGFLLTSDFFQNKMKTEFEVDLSRFDPDTSDEFGPQNDSAYLARAYGVLGEHYNYDAKYEYFGKNYATLGNLGAYKDREGVSLSQGLNINKHTFLLALSGANDNVTSDPLFAKIYQYAGGLNYTYNGIQNLSVGLGYQKSLQESRNEPGGLESLNTMTDTVSGNINYTAGKIMLGLTALYSILDDRTLNNADMTTSTITFSPTYFQPELSVTPMFSWNSSKNELMNVRTDSYTGGLNVMSKLGDFTFDLGGTYTIVKADDNSVDTRQINATANLSYSLKGDYVKYINPVVILRNTYIKTTDEVNPSADSDNYGLSLVITGNMPFLF
ncbi:MAG: hypothetical protein CVU55_08315 [Deltaproteobacteria bacterium HGW-Deltaproteobacteria-13]|nr:MAG: hypothetical protein CVU55_08315 [Deltaproteobacteria bacterium HGW-Deltaproteobacteria-13]